MHEICIKVRSSTGTKQFPFLGLQESIKRSCNKFDSQRYGNQVIGPAPLIHLLLSSPTTDC